MEMNETVVGRLNVEEAAQFLGVSKPTLYRLLSSGALKGLKAGKQWRFDKNVLTAYLNRSPVEASAPSAEITDAEIRYFQSELGKRGHEFGEAPASKGEEEKIHLLFDLIVYLAIRSHASDIHLEPTKDDGKGSLLLRYREDGLLATIRNFPIELYEPLLIKIKQRAGMESNERRLPQHGRILMNVSEKRFELVAATLPILHGESVTIRIVDREHILPTLEQIGVIGDDPLLEWISRPNGIVLFTGSPGSGKDTTLYAAVREIAREESKVLSIEDPVEFLLPHTTQAEVNKKNGLTFISILKAFWRQDPDILVIRGLEEPEGIRMAVEFGLTGHAVLMNLNASSAALGLRILLDSGVEPLSLARTLIGVSSQRLLRRICSDCKESYPLESSDPIYQRLKELGKAGGFSFPENVTLSRGKGCASCQNRGVRGRVALHERLPNSPLVSEAILRGAEASEISQIAVGEGMKTLFGEGLRMATEGIIALDELLREVSPSSFR